MTRDEAKEFIAQSVKSDVDIALVADAINTLEQEPTTKNDLGVDCISRKAVLDITWQDPSYADPLNVLTEVRDKVRELPSVTPQEPKTGHWIEEFVDTEGEVRFTCSCCGKYQLFGTDFCYNCGAKMEEVIEE